MEADGYHRQPSVALGYHRLVSNFTGDYQWENSERTHCKRDVKPLKTNQCTFTIVIFLWISFVTYGPVYAVVHMGCVMPRELYCDVKILILDAETSIPNAEKSIALTHFIKLISVDGSYTTIILIIQFSVLFVGV